MRSRHALPLILAVLALPAAKRARRARRLPATLVASGGPARVAAPVTVTS